MIVIEKGHHYAMENKHLDDKLLAAVNARSGRVRPPNELVFVNQQPGQEHGGTTTQEVIRALLDRTRHCANCMPHPNNERIVHHLRMALTLHEARALERRVEKGEIRPEYLPTVGGSHLELPEEKLPEGPVTEHLLPHPMDGAKVINHPVADERSGRICR